MSFLGIFLIALAKVISLIAGIYTLIVAGVVICSWVRADSCNPIVGFLYQATDPVFRRIRRCLPHSFFASGIDWTPMIVIILLVFLETILSESLMEWGNRLRY